MEKHNMTNSKTIKKIITIVSVIAIIILIVLYAKYFKEKRDKEIGNIIRNAMTETKENSITGEDEIYVLAEEEYLVDGEKVLLTLKEESSEIEMSVLGNAKTEEKASLMFVELNSQFKKLPVDRYSITVFCGKLCVMYIITDNGSIISGTNKDGSTAFTMPDWIVSDITMSEDEINSYESEIVSSLKDFVENID